MDLFGDDSDDGPDDVPEEFDAELADGAMVGCPYCGEEVEIIVDAGGGGVQEYVEDCEVCCRPLSVRVSIGVDRLPTVTVGTLDDA